MKSHYFFIWMILGAMMVSGINQAMADEDYELARKLRESGQILALEEIVKRARTVKPGELLETELETKHGHYIYEVEMLDKTGQVWELKLDAATGKLIEMERDD